MKRVVKRHDLIAIVDKRALEVVLVDESVPPIEAIEPAQIFLCTEESILVLARIAIMLLDFFENRVIPLIRIPEK